VIDICRTSATVVIGKHESQHVWMQPLRVYKRFTSLIVASEPEKMRPMACLPPILACISKSC